MSHPAPIIRTALVAALRDRLTAESTPITRDNARHEASALMPHLPKLAQTSSGERKLAGALKCCVDAHGPIDRTWIGSVTKRAVPTLAR